MDWLFKDRCDYIIYFSFKLNDKQVIDEKYFYVINYNIQQFIISVIPYY